MEKERKDGKGSAVVAFSSFAVADEGILLTQDFRLAHVQFLALTYGPFLWRYPLPGRERSSSAT
jgi:hypothetical protein